MAECVGLAASVAGLVSLGLQVAGGIVTYLDALEARQDELASLKRQNDSLSAALRIIDAASSRFQTEPHGHTITESIRSCVVELKAIEVLLADLADCDTTTWRLLIRNTKKRLSYAFDRSKVQQVIQRLHNSNEVLQLTLTGLGLNISGSNMDKLTAIEATSQGNASELLQLRSELTAVIAPLTEIRDEVPLLKSGIDATSSLVASHSMITSDHIQESSRAMQHGIERSHDSLQLTLGSQMEKIERIEQLLKVLQVNSRRNHSAELLARRAAGKPAALKELCDSIRAPEQDPRKHVPLHVSPLDSQHSAFFDTQNSQFVAAKGRTCICPRLHRSAMYRGVRWGHFHFSHELENLVHWPSCPLSKAQSTGKSRRAVYLKYTGLGQALKSVISVSFAMTSGAGGFSIGPTFTHYPTVDDRLDPAFRIMGLLCGCPLKGNLFEDMDIFLRVCTQRLVWLFEKRKACPTAITPQGGSLMHFATTAFSSSALNFHDDSPRVFSAFPALMRTLLEYGVPAFTYDSTGRSPLVQAIETGNMCNVDVISLLVQANSEGRPAVTHHAKRWIPKLCAMYEESPGLAEGACGCGPLSMAVIVNNLPEVTRILDRAPKSISEVDIAGQSPIHLAVSKGDILTRLAKVASPQQLDQRDGSFSTTLEIAMGLSASLCINGTSAEICQGCDCAQCVDILLEAGCGVRMERVRGIRQLPLLNILEPASEQARYRYIFHMKEHWTRRIFPYHEWKSPRTDSQAQGTSFCDINTPTPTQETQPTHTGADSSARHLAWVYEEIRDKHLAGLFHGFGIRPDPSLFFRLGGWQGGWKYNPDNPGELIAYVDWLARHGADLYLKSPKGPPDLRNNSDIGLFGAHYAFYIVGRATSWPLIDVPQHPFAHLGNWTEDNKNVVRGNLTDCCECSCSTRGCDPFLWLLKGLVGSTPNRGYSPEDYVYYMEHYYSRCETDFTALTFQAAIRYTTFQVLNLSHTCCNADDLIYSSAHMVNEQNQSTHGEWLAKDDVEIINEEQAHLLKLHEELVAEFQGEAPEYIEDGSDGCSRFHLFWSKNWMVRIKEELMKRSDDKLTDEEKRGAEEIGVRWFGPQVKQRPDKKLEKGERNPYDRKTLEHWFFELDLACPELKEPWPEELCRVDELP